MQHGNKKDKLLKILLIFLTGGIFGFVYETIFYRFELGYFVKRGITFGPWIPIYGYGAVFIYLLAKKYKDSKLKVLLVSSLSAGSLEFIVGYLLYHIKHMRLWDYNTESLNFLNIGGYICLRSVLFFGISGLLLIYIINPLIEKLLTKNKSTLLRIIFYIISFTFIIDIIISSLRVV